MNRVSRCGLLHITLRYFSVTCTRGDPEQAWHAQVFRKTLSHSRMVVEDDTGLPFRFFEQTAWDVRLNGSYAEPIRLFGRWHQEDLKGAFIARADEQPLDFAIGYRHRNESSLLVAKRRGK